MNTLILIGLASIVLTAGSIAAPYLSNPATALQDSDNAALWSGPNAPSVDFIQNVARKVSGDLGKDPSAFLAGDRGGALPAFVAGDEAFGPGDYLRAGGVSRINVSRREPGCTVEARWSVADKAAAVDCVERLTEALWKKGWHVQVNGTGLICAKCARTKDQFGPGEDFYTHVHNTGSQVLGASREPVDPDRELTSSAFPGVKINLALLDPGTGGAVAWMLVGRGPQGGGRPGRQQDSTPTSPDQKSATSVLATGIVHFKDTTTEDEIDTRFFNSVAYVSGKGKNRMLNIPYLWLKSGARMIFRAFIGEEDSGDLGAGWFTKDLDQNGNHQGQVWLFRDKHTYRSGGRWLNKQQMESVGTFGYKIKGDTVEIDFSTDLYEKNDKISVWGEATLPLGKE